MTTSMTEQQNAIALAALQVEVSYLKVAVSDLRATNTLQNEKLDKVLAQLAEARGGWRTLMLIGGAAGSIGSGLTWVLSHLKA
jgi:hypothetical protein